MANKNTSIYKIFWFISCCLWASHVAAVDVLNQGDVLNSSASLVSRNGLFTLRFFNLRSNGDSISDYSYLGIFYRNDTFPGKPFWIANRDMLITDNSGALVIDETGKLIITFNGGKAPLELFSGQSNNKVTAILQDDGNFVLKSGEQILWQSFDFPTDRFLPGMKLGINKAGRNWSLTSWLTDSIPAPGAFSLDWDPDEHQLILRRRGVTFWTSGVLENNTFENINLDGGEADHKFIEVSNEEGKYLTYELLRNQDTPKSWINVTWLWLEYNGFMTVMNKRSNTVVLISDECDGNRISSGCKRWEGPKCRSRGENFQPDVRGHFPDSVDRSVDLNASLSLSDCKDICWKNCTCVGTATRLNPNGTGCAFWYGLLEETPTNTTASSYYIIRPGPPGVRNWWIPAVIAVAATIVIGIILVIVFVFFMRWRRARFEEKFLLELMNEAKELEIEGRKGFNLKVYSVSSIMDATHCFSNENKLGEGGYGPVYKGLFDGQEIAIKRLSRSSRQGLAEFKNELIIVAKLQHKNLVQLLGFCIQGEEKMLVYEFMPHNSLDSYIFDQSKRKLFDWNKYFNIIEEIAQGILYLHKYSRLQIIHRDLKSSNILLDNNMNPKISDFGMARIFTTIQSEANTNRIVGTRGYMAPEYAVMGIFSTKSDVFSYGVLVLEIVSGRRSNSNFNFDQPLNLIGYAWMLWKEDAALELMHPALRNSCSEDRVMRCINVALLCVEDNPLDRPSMADVIYMLTSECVELTMPKQPAFCIERRVAEVNSSTGGMAENHTINNLTMSVMTGRL